MSAPAEPRLPTGSGRTVPIGIGLRILSGVFFVAMSCCVKALAEAVPVGQIVFFRSVVAMVPLVLFLMWCREWPQGLATRRPFGHLGRCLLGCLAMFTSFAALGLLPVADATLLTYLSPLFMVMLAGPLLGERVHAVRWLGVLIGLSGVAVLVVPEMTAPFDDTDRLLGLGLGVATALLTAGALMQVRRLAETESTGAIAFYFVLVCATVGLATWPLGWVTPTPTELALLVGAGLFGGAAHIAMTVSFRFAPVSALAPFEYVAILWAVLGDLLLFSIWPGAAFGGAAALVIGGALLVMRQEIVRARREQAAAPD